MIYIVWEIIEEINGIYNSFVFFIFLNRKVVWNFNICKILIYVLWEVIIIVCDVVF